MCIVLSDNNLDLLSLYPFEPVLSISRMIIAGTNARSRVKLLSP